MDDNTRLVYVDLKMVEEKYASANDKSDFELFLIFMKKNI